MKLFLSHESETPASGIISQLRNDIYARFSLLISSHDDSYYGNDVFVLCIITSCVSETFLKNSGWKERIRYSKKDKLTDIRLNMDYEKFLAVDIQSQYQMYTQNIIDSIKKFKNKYPHLDFKSDLLIHDLFSIL